MPGVGFVEQGHQNAGVEEHIGVPRARGRAGPHLLFAH
jgi:hypothetical protein